MPPISSLSYRVLFYYTPYRTVQDFWKNEGKDWSKMHDKFIGPGPSVKAAVQSLTSPSDTQDQKLRKFYAAVMQLENTDFTREHSNSEEKAEGFKPIRSTDDVWDRKRGSSDQLSDLFVAMARAAGMKAYVMAVTNRDRNVFLQSYFNLSQLDDDLAIVNVDGKDKFFDPGSRFSAYGHLAWKHTRASGLRQTDGGTAFANAPGELYSTSGVQRIADLTLDSHGVATGTVRMVYTGAPALRWRQRSLTGDATSLEHDLRTSVEELLPAGMDVKVTSIEKLADYEAAAARQSHRQGSNRFLDRQASADPGRPLRGQLQTQLPPREARDPGLLRLSFRPSGCGSRPLPIVAGGGIAARER